MLLTTSSNVRMSPTLLTVLTGAIGITVLPLFAAQPLVGLIGPSLGLSLALAGLMPTLPLLGYAVGLILFVPLIDLFESRTIILWTLGLDVCALVLIACAPTPLLFLLAAFAVGVATSSIQMLIPVAAAMTPEHLRGRTIGTLMSGLMIGILLSRPLASLVASELGWRASYVLDAAALAGVALTLLVLLPRHQPATKGSYDALVRSLRRLLAEEPLLRRRALYQALCMAAFSSFWTAIALRLAASPFDLTQIGIGLFALAGAGGAVVSPIAGRAGDRGLTVAATRLSHLTAIGALVLAGIAGAGWFGFDAANHGRLGLGLLAVAAFALDLGVVGDQTLGRRVINMLRPEARGRINGLFTGLFFVGSATGSALSGVAWSVSGWSAVCWLGLFFTTVAFLLSWQRQGASEEAPCLT